MYFYFISMSKFIRNNQLDKYEKDEEENIRQNRKKKIKKFKNNEEPINKLVKKY